MYNKTSLISAFVVLLLAVSVFAYPVQLRLQSNVVGFDTKVYKCTDSSCSTAVDGSEQNVNTGTDMNVYSISGSGTVTWAELDYKVGYLPHIYRFQADDSTLNGPFTVSRDFVKKSACEANVNSISFSSESVEENQKLTATAGIQSAISLPFESLSTVLIPTELKDFYDSETNVVFRVKDSNGTVVYTNSSSVAPWINKSESTSFEFTPTTNVATPEQNATYTAEIETEVTASFCTSTNAKTSQLNFTISDAGPQANAGGDKTVDEDVSVLFDASQTVSADSLILYLWDFGDNTPSATGQIVNHTYQNPGTFTVTLEVVDKDGQHSTNTATITVNFVNHIPTAAFTSADSVVEGQPLQFTDSSTSLDGIASRTWDFGDGQTSTETNPSHTFAQNDSYTVTLTVTDDQGDPNTVTKQVTVTDTKPVVDFSFGSAVEGQVVQFNNSATAYDGIQSLSWDFGDGDTSLSANPSHTFASAETYDVVLTVTDNDGSVETKTKQVVVDAQAQVPGPVVVVDSVDDSFEGSVVEFTAQVTSQNPITTYEWDFAFDGTFDPAPTYTTQVVLFSFDTPGTYTIASRVTDSENQSTVGEKTVTVKQSLQDISVDTISQSKSASTVYLFDTVEVKSNVTNLGSSAQNVTVRLKEGLVTVDSQVVSLGVGETKEVSFNWTPEIKGTRSVRVEAVAVSGETKVANNIKSVDVKVFSVEDNVVITFNQPSTFPSSNEPKNSEFYVWVTVENKGLTTLKDLKVTLDLPLTITGSIDGSLDATTLQTLATGESTPYWWKVSSGTGGTFDPKVTVGNTNDQVSVTKQVVVS